MGGGGGQCRGVKGSVPPPAPAMGTNSMPYIASQPSAEAEAEHTTDPRRSCSVGVCGMPSALTVPQIELQVQDLPWAVDHTQPICGAGS